MTAATGGSHQLMIAYCNGEASRSASMSVNGGGPTTIPFPGTGSFGTPGSIAVPVTLNAGANTITFSNPSGWAPDFDRIIV